MKVSFFSEKMTTDFYDYMKEDWSGVVEFYKNWDKLEEVWVKYSLKHLGLHYIRGTKFREFEVVDPKKWLVAKLKYVI